MGDDGRDAPGRDEPEPPRDAAYWAEGGDRLNGPDVPEGAVNINVTGKRLAGPVQGFGKMWQKTYQVRLPADRVSADRPDRRPGRSASPSSGRRATGSTRPLTGIAPGEVALLNLTLPGGVRLSTGVMVLYADEESFTLMTPQGHMFAGWITFSATERDGETVAQAQVLMRASDPIFELGLTLGGHRQEDSSGPRRCARLAAHFGHSPEVHTPGRVRGQAPAVDALDEHLAVVGDPVHGVHDGGALARCEGARAPGARRLGRVAVRVGHRDDVADDHDRGRPDRFAGHVPRRPSPSVESRVRSPGIVPSETIATGVARRPAAGDERGPRSAGRFCTAISSTTVPRSRGDGVPLDQGVRVVGRAGARR